MMQTRNKAKLIKLSSHNKHYGNSGFDSKAILHAAFLRIYWRYLALFFILYFQARRALGVTFGFN